MKARSQRNPPRGAPRLLADQQYGREQTDRQKIERGDVGHQRVIIDRSGQPHQQQAEPDPNDLLPPGIVQRGAQGGAEDLDYAQGTNYYHDDQHPPVDVPAIQITAHSRSSAGAGDSGTGETGAVARGLLTASKLCPSRAFLST